MARMGTRKHKDKKLLILHGEMTTPFVADMAQALLM